MTVKQLLETIDTSKTQRGYIELSCICENAFGIFEYVEQPSGKGRLTYCYYCNWLCTDTDAGIRVWYFDEKPVAISYKLYRKAAEHFSWITRDYFFEVRNYIYSLLARNEEVDLARDETLEGVLNHINSDLFGKVFFELNTKNN